MYYVIFGLLGAALLGADQWVKAWVVGHLQMGETTSLFPGFLELMRVHNYGAAWSSFAGQKRSEERRVGKECRSRWSPYH